MKILIKNGTIANPDKIFKADILLNQSKILRVGKNISEPADKEIEAQGKTVFAGFIDMHSHLRSPGREDEEDLLSGSQAAAKGGFTKIFCMPNTDPPLDNESAAQWIREEAHRLGVVDIYPVGAITKGRQGHSLTEFVALKRAGCLSLSDDGSCLEDSLLLRRALDYAKLCDLLIVSHCEDSRLSNKGAMREGALSSRYGISAVPAIAESLVVSRDIEIARYLEARIHLAHISTAQSLAIIKRAKAEGVKVTCETCPHYFILTTKEIEASGFDANLKVNPPLGEQKDIEAIKQAIKEGVVDCLVTDHAPHSAAEKELPFEDAPFGLIGLELAFSLTYTYLVDQGIIDLKHAASLLSAKPAEILGLARCGKVEEGYEASLTIIDLAKSWQPAKDNIVSKSKNTPFLGRELRGVVEGTICQGKIVYAAGQGE